MTLSCKPSTGGGKPVEADVSVYSGVIEDVGLLSGVTPEGWQKPIEVGLKFYLEQGTLKFQPELMVYGSVKRAPDGTIEDWGGAFPVRDVIASIGGYDGPIGEDLNIPDVVRRQMVGKTVHYIRYKSNRSKEDGTYYNSTFRELAQTEAEVVGKWKRSRSKGYPKDYFHSNPIAAGTPVTSDSLVF